MLNILEKIQYGVSGLVVLGSLVLYLWQGTDSRTSDMFEALKPVKTSRPTPPPRPGAKALPPAPSPTAAEDKAILDRLAKEQNVQGATTLEHKDYEVDKETFSFVSREANWQPELNKAASELLPGADGKSSRILITKIDENSLFKKFGFEDNDIIEFIDGEKINFSDASAVDHIERWKKLKDKMQKGGKIYLTVTRNGQPTQIEFKLGK